MTARVDRITIYCEVCATPRLIVPSQVGRSRYCSKPCAHVGQGRRRRVWNKGLTAATDPTVKVVSDAVSAFYKANPEHRRGVNHHMYGKKHTPESIAKMSAATKKQVVTPGMRRGLEIGRQWCKGLTAKTSPSLARRGKAVSLRLKGSKHPSHSAHMKKFYEKHPEKHPNRLLAQKGHETDIERLMREALGTVGLEFVTQFHIGRFWADFAIPSAHLIIEVDGAYWHDEAHDRQRDAWLTKHGWRVLRFTGKAINRDPTACAEHVRTYLELSGVRCSPTGKEPPP